MSEDEVKVFDIIINSEIGSYECSYALRQNAISCKAIMKISGLSEYKVKKSIKSLVEQGYIERVSVGRPAVESYNGECYELICEAMPPLNGFALTVKGLNSSEYKDAYNAWTKRMNEWLEGIKKNGI